MMPNTHTEACSIPQALTQRADATGQISRVTTMAPTAVMPADCSGMVLVVWRVLALPTRVFAAGVPPPISCLLNRTRPAVGVWSPETTLNKVDLPAPLGPITEKT